MRIDEVMDEEGKPLFRFTKLGAIIAEKVAEYNERSKAIRENKKME